MSTPTGNKIVPVLFSKQTKSVEYGRSLHARVLHQCLKAGYHCPNISPMLTSMTEDATPARPLKHLTLYGSSSAPIRQQDCSACSVFVNLHSAIKFHTVSLDKTQLQQSMRAICPSPD